MRPTALASLALCATLALAVPFAVAADPVAVGHECATTPWAGVEDGDRTTRYERACTRTVAVGTEEGAVADIAVRHSWERVTYASPTGEYRGEYTTDRKTVTVSAPAAGAAPVVVDVAEQEGGTRFQEGDRLVWHERVVRADAAGVAHERAIVFYLSHPGGTRCGVAYNNPVTGSEHGVGVPLADACGLLA